MVTRPSTMPKAPGMTLSPHVRESKTVLDSGFHAVDSGSSDWIPELLELHSGFQSPAIRIPHSKLSRIPKSRLPHMGSLLGLLRSLRASLRQSNPKMYTLIWYPDLPRISFFRVQHNPTSDYAKNKRISELANHLTQWIKNNVRQELQNSLQKK